jgi:microcystin-dependent protein
MSSVLLSSLGTGVEWIAGPSGITLGAGRKVYVYQRGTSNYVSVFQDQAMTILMTQPVTTDAYGNIPGYVLGGQSVDFLDVTSNSRTQGEPLSAADISALLTQSSVHLPGDLIHSAAATRVGALLCNGATFTKASYPNLFAAIGTTYGVGNNDGVSGSLPNFVNNVVVGAGGSYALGSVGGEVSHVLASGESGVNGNGSTGTESADHYHLLQNSMGVSMNIASYGGGASNSFYFGAGGAPSHPNYGMPVNDSTGNNSVPHSHALVARNADAAHNNLQPYGTANVFIKF